MTPLLEQSFKIKPKSSDTYLVRGSLNLFYRNKVEDAKSDIEMAMKLKSWPRIPTNFCTCIITSTYVALLDLEKAKESIDLSMSLDPENFLLSSDKANVYMIEGKYQEAQKVLLKTVGKSNNNYYNTFLGWSYYHGGKYDMALKYLQRAYED